MPVTINGQPIEKVEALENGKATLDKLIEFYVNAQFVQERDEWEATVEAWKRRVETLKRQYADAANWAVDMRSAVYAIYIAAPWGDPTGKLTIEQQRELWTNLRNAAHIAPGTATFFRVGVASTSSERTL